jgi:hypothetical protein
MVSLLVTENTYNLFVIFQVTIGMTVDLYRKPVVKYSKVESNIIDTADLN